MTKASSSSPARPKPAPDIRGPSLPAERPLGGYPPAGVAAIAGNVVFLDTAGPPPESYCQTWAVYYQRPFENGGEVGGWWTVITATHDTIVKGPFGSKREAVAVARLWADRCGCIYLP